MAIVIGVRFKKPGKVYYFDPCGLEVKAEDPVVVETVRGVEMGECAREPYEVPDEEIVPPLRKVVRLASETDVAQMEQNRASERRAYDICQEKIAFHKLEMKLVDVEYAFDCSKIVFYFTANGRVDFRALVKDLASVFKTRIELRQIGVRDEAKMLGGLGPCGRPICCGTFLGDFQPVSIKMAKEQNLSLNPTKISGLCGRLMCCLKYEQDAYEEARKRLPRMGKDVITPDGRGHVIDVNVLRETVRVRFLSGDSFEVKEYAAADVQRIAPQEAERRAPAPEAETPSDGGDEAPAEGTGENEPAAEGMEKPVVAEKQLAKPPRAEALPAARPQGAREGQRPRRRPPLAEGEAQKRRPPRPNGPRKPLPAGEAPKPGVPGEAKAPEKQHRRRPNFTPNPRRDKPAPRDPQQPQTPPPQLQTPPQGQQAQQPQPRPPRPPRPNRPQGGETPPASEE